MEKEERGIKFILLSVEKNYSGLNQLPTIRLCPVSIIFLRESFQILSGKFFCLEYIKDFNSTETAIRASHSKKTAAAIASENPQIALNEIKRLDMRCNTII